MSASLSQDTTQVTPGDTSGGMDISIDGKGLEEIIGDETTDIKAGEDIKPETDVTSVEDGIKEVEEKRLAGKFNSPEELEKAYKELESKFGQTSQEKANLQKAFEQLAPVFNENLDTEQPISEIEDPEKRLESLVFKATSRAMAPQQANLAIERLVVKHPDFSNYIDDIKGVLQEMPQLLDNKETGLERAYRIAKADRFEQEKSRAKEDGKKEAYQSIANKSISGVEGASKAGERKGPLSAAEFSKLSTEEKEKIISELPGVSMT